MAPIEGSRRRSRLWGGFTLPFDLPPLRHFVTPLLKERLVWLPLRGAGNNVNCGVVYLMATNGRHYNTDIFYAFLATTL